MNDIDAVNIRLMEGNGEKKVVKNIMCQSFPFIQQLFFSFSPHVLVAEINNEIVGAVVIKLIKLPKKRKGGFISWLFTSPKQRRLGIGQKLIEEAISFFKENKCDEILACVEGFNTSSSNIFKNHDFSLLSPGEQFRRYGIRFLAVWFKIFHFIDAGFFVWAYPSKIAADKPKRQFIGNVMINSFIVLLSSWRWNLFRTINPHFFYMIPISMLLIFFMRESIMRVGMRTTGLSVRFRPWESGFFLSVLLALFFGYYYPIPGSIYPDKDEWKYRDIKNRLGCCAFLSSFFLLLIVWTLSLLLSLFSFSTEIKLWIVTMRMIIHPLAIFDILFPFFPFLSFNGRRVWDWNRYMWMILVVLAIITIFLIL